jgi:nitrile hydratase
MENTPATHNLVVCTLCSCYPTTYLGNPPGWYKSRSYRPRAVREPRKLLAEFGVRLEPGKRVQVHDSTADLRYMVLPERPSGAAGWSEEKLMALLTRDCLVGAALPLQAPEALASGGVL